MITNAQAAEYMATSYGIAVPSFILDAAISQVASVESAMISAGYTPAAIVLMQAMAVTLIATANGAPQRIQSQGAPSGASRSFFNDPKAMLKLQQALEDQDPLAILGPIIGYGNGGALFAVIG